MTEPTERLPSPDNKDLDRESTNDDRVMDPRDLAYTGGFQGSAREIVENPAVTPEMPNEPGDLRSDMLEED